jgi:hypothetical protein
MRVAGHANSSDWPEADARHRRVWVDQTHWRTSHSRNHWQPFAYEAFAPYRTELLLLGRALPLKAARTSAVNLLEAVGSIVTEPTTSVN